MTILKELALLASQTGVGEHSPLGEGVLELDTQALRIQRGAKSLPVR